MGELAEFIKEHPELMIFAVLIVVVLALMNRSSGAASSDGVTFTGGGVAPLPTDPGVVSMEEARINAGTANLTTLSQLTLGLQEAAYSRDVAEGQTSAALTSSLAQTEAQRVVSLAGIDANVKMNADSIAGQIQGAQISSSAATEQARINAQSQSDITAANLKATLEDQATQRDIARVQAKENEVTKLEDIGKDVVHILTLGLVF